MLNLQLPIGIWFVIFSLIVLSLFGFWLWMLISMLTEKKLTKQAKGIWFILFFAFNLLTAIVYLIIKPRGKK